MFLNFRTTSFRAFQRAARSMRDEAGFTLLETLVVVGIAGVVLATTVMVSDGFVKMSKSDSASVGLESELRLARSRAVGERRTIELVFINTEQLDIVRHKIPGAPGPATEVVSQHRLESGQAFTRIAGMVDTPDAFGGIAGAISFNGAPRFTSEGTLVDNDGDLLNGTLFFGKQGDPMTARAITIFGISGLIRTWKWNGTRWTE